LADVCAAAALSSAFVGDEVILYCSSSLASALADVRGNIRFLRRLKPQRSAVYRSVRGSSFIVGCRRNCAAALALSSAILAECARRQMFAMNSFVVSCICFVVGCSRRCLRVTGRCQAEEAIEARKRTKIDNL
jgi:hypothetical protein